MKFFYENKGMVIEARYESHLEYGAHLHPSIELIFMLDGQVTALVDSLPYVLTPGDLLLVFPNQVHQYVQDSTKNSIVCLFPPQICPGLSGLIKSKIPLCPLLTQIADQFDLVPILRRVIEVSRDVPPFADVVIQGGFMLILGELFGRMSFLDAKAPGSNVIRDLLIYCSDNYHSDLKLGTLSDALHLSGHYLSHLFSEKLHMRFSDYIGMLRVSEAQRLLRDSEDTVAQIAYQVGFNSIRTFNRAFVKHVGMTPRQYRSG